MLQIKSDSHVDNRKYTATVTVDSVKFTYKLFIFINYY